MTQECQAVRCASLCYYQLRRIRQMRRFVDDNALRTLVHSLVKSRLDYCNSLLAGCGVSHCASPACTEQCGQIDLQPAPWISLCTTVTVCQLHRLPITSRIQYKLCLLMCDVFHVIAPSYLKETSDCLSRCFL